jgi:hypothetical protein
MAVDDLLVKLERVRPTGKGRWVAKCPAHQDSNPSLSIRELDDGRILLHDFAGCSIEDVINSLGLSFEDLMPGKVNELKKNEHRPFTASDALRCVSFEALLVASAACRVAAGQPIDNSDRERLLLALSCKARKKM